MGKTVSCTKVSKKLSTWANVTKYIMGFCFIILFLLGMVLFIISTVAVSGSNLLGDFDITGFTALLYMGIFLGLFLAVASILGAIGFFSLRRCLLIIFVCFIAALAIVQAVVGLVAVSYSEEKRMDLITDGWNIADNSTRAYLEDHFDCCGGANFSDGPASDKCIALSNSTSNSTSHSYSGSEKPCVVVLEEYVEDYMLTVGIGIIVVTLLEVAVIVVTVILVIQIDRAKKKYSKVDDDESLDPLK